MRFIEKRLKVNNVKRLLKGEFSADKGAFKNVKSVAIFSCQSPTGAIIDNKPFVEWLEDTKGITLEEWNKKSMEKARKLLKKYRFRVVDGLYAGHEKSFVVFDIERETVEKINKDFYQQAYMFLNLVDDIPEDVGSGLHFGKDANGNNVRTLKRHGDKNEAAGKVAYIETWSRSDEVDNDGNNIYNEYTLMETSFGIEIDETFMKNYDKPNKDDLNKMQTRLDSRMGFSAKYKSYGESPDDFEGSPMDLKRKVSERLKVYNRILEETN